jgi:hypothetical protein
MQREEMKLMAVRATLWRMEIELLREIHRYRFAKRGRRFGSDVELMIVYGAGDGSLRLRDASASTADLALP